MSRNTDDTISTAAEDRAPFLTFLLAMGKFKAHLGKLPPEAVEHFNALKDAVRDAYQPGLADAHKKAKERHKKPKNP